MSARVTQLGEAARAVSLLRQAIRLLRNDDVLDAPQARLMGEAVTTLDQLVRKLKEAVE